MRFFLDTANLEELKAGARWGVVDGVTTNPTLIAKEGVPIEEQIRKICDIVNGDISAEVVATDTDGMLTQGRALAKIHKNVVVKVPLTRDGIRACSIFSREGIRVNVTLCFSAGQAILAAKVKEAHECARAEALRDAARQFDAAAHGIGAVARQGVDQRTPMRAHAPRTIE